MGLTVGGLGEGNEVGRRGQGWVEVVKHRTLWARGVLGAREPGPAIVVEGRGDDGHPESEDSPCTPWRSQPVEVA